MAPTLLFGATLCVLLGSEIAVGQSNSYAVLNNGRGETPCNLAVTLCSSSYSSPLNTSSTTPPSPTTCSCSSVFFNVWSACKLINGQALPNWDNWQTDCSDKSFTPLAGFPDSNGNFDIPSWTRISIPDDTHMFDAVEAIRVAGGAGWTPVQKALPGIVGVSILALAIGVFLFMRRRRRLKASSSTLSSPHTDVGGVFHKIRHVLPFSRATKVQGSGRKASWNIDDGRVRVDDEDVEDGRIQLNSATSPAFTKFPNGHDGQRPGSSASASSSWNEVRPIEQLKSALYRIHLPWKAGPRPVRPGPRDNKFRMDDFDASTESSTSRRATMQSSRMGTSIFSASRSNTRDVLWEEGEEVLIEEPDAEAATTSGQQPSRKWSKWRRREREEDEDDERQTLLSPGGRSGNSILIIGNPQSSEGRSHAGHSNSNIHIKITEATPVPSVKSPRIPSKRVSSPGTPAATLTRPNAQAARNHHQRPTLPPLQTSSSALHQPMQPQALPPLVIDGVSKNSNQALRPNRAPSNNDVNNVYNASNSHQNNPYQQQHHPYQHQPQRYHPHSHSQSQLQSYSAGQRIASSSSARARARSRSHSRVRAKAELQQTETSSDSPHLFTKTAPPPSASAPALGVYQYSLHSQSQSQSQVQLQLQQQQKQQPQQQQQPQPQPQRRIDERPSLSSLANSNSASASAASAGDRAGLLDEALLRRPVHADSYPPPHLPTHSQPPFHPHSHAQPQHHHAHGRPGARRGFSDDSILLTSLSSASASTPNLHFESVPVAMAVSLSLSASGEASGEGYPKTVSPVSLSLSAGSKPSLASLAHSFESPSSGSGSGLGLDVPSSVSSVGRNHPYGYPQGHAGSVSTGSSGSGNSGNSGASPGGGGGPGLGQQTGTKKGHVKSSSTEMAVHVRPSRGDPVMLFPGSVRAAGYMVSPQVSQVALPLVGGAGDDGGGDTSAGGLSQSQRQSPSQVRVNTPLSYSQTAPPPQYTTSTSAPGDVNVYGAYRDVESDDEDLYYQPIRTVDH